MKKEYENYEGGISEYVTMLTMKPCTDYLPSVIYTRKWYR